MNKEIKITILVLHIGTGKFLKCIQNSKGFFYDFFLMWTIFLIVSISGILLKTTASVLCFGFLDMRHVGS